MISFLTVNVVANVVVDVIFIIVVYIVFIAMFIVVVVAIARVIPKSISKASSDGHRYNSGLSFRVANALWARITRNPDCSIGLLTRLFARGKVDDFMTIFSVFFFFPGP